MVSSTLNPKAITKNNPATLDSFGSFMSSGTLSKSSTVLDASNKIVDFSRTNVAPLSSNISSLISNISTNILNQFDKSIQNTTNFIKGENDLDLSKLRNDLYSRIIELQSNINTSQKDTFSRLDDIDINKSKIEDLINRLNQLNIADSSKFRTDIQSDEQKYIQSQISEIVKDVKSEIKVIKISSENVENITLTKVDYLIKEIEKLNSLMGYEIIPKVDKLSSEVLSYQLEQSVVPSQKDVDEAKSFVDIVQDKQIKDLEYKVNLDTLGQPDIVGVSNEVEALKLQMLGNNVAQQNVNNDSLGSLVKSNEDEYQNAQINDLQYQVNTLSQSTVEPKTSVSGIQQVVENIQVQVQNVLDNTIRSFSKNYQERIKGFDDARPNNVLSKFLDLYRNAIGFINFFGDRKNISVIEKNLKSLRLMFEESFDVATTLRKTIIKIVNQLSNLPTASPSSGGLNLDIDVPGGRLKQGAGSKVRNIGNIARMGGIAGAGLLGLGGAAMAATGMGRAREYQESLLEQSKVSSISGEQYIPENVVESFSVIVDRFTNAVNSLISGAKSSSGGNIGTSTPSSGGPSPSSKPSSGSSFSSGVQIKDDMQGLKELGLTQQEWDVYKQGIADVESARYDQMGGSGGRFAGRYQMGDEAITEAAKVLGIAKPSREQFLNDPKLQEKMYLGYTISNFRYMQNLSPEFRNMSRQQQLSVLPMAQLGIRNLTNQLKTGQISKDAWGTPTTKFSQAVERRRKEAGILPLGQNVPKVEGLSQVKASSTKIEEVQSRAQSISQPAQKVPQTISLPPTIIDMSSGGDEGSDSGGVSPIPVQPPSPGPQVPYLPTTNPDNFLTMYSRIVYNIVDG